VKFEICDFGFVSDFMLRISNLAPTLLATQDRPMKVSEILEQRQGNWEELQRLCGMLESGKRKRLPPDVLARFASLYRAACADLALADAYQLPPGMVHYLHQLVARAHNQLYRSRQFTTRVWFHEMFYRVPRRLFRDKFLWLSFALFFGFGVSSYFLARFVPEFARVAIPQEEREGMEQMYSQATTRGGFGGDSAMAGYYVQHNAGIGIQCFAGGIILCGFGGMFAVIFNACMLGAVFGYMDTTSAAGNFNNFVTAHAPFELTAIVLSGAAGMRLGFSYVFTKGLSRADSLRRAGRESLPIMMAAIILFVLAASIEGYVSASPLPYWIKATVAVVSGFTLLFYFVLLGMPRMGEDWDDDEVAAAVVQDV
jgi:uncharacterized membrane protein SpoIIM required for sporulation